MKKLVAVVVVSSAGLWLASCAEPASEDEITQMCQRLGDVSAKADTPDEARKRVAKVTEDYETRLKKLEAEKKETLGRLGAEEQAARTGTDVQKTEERSAIVDEFAKKTTTQTVEFDAKIKQMTLDRDEAVKKAQEAADAAEADWNEIVFKCTGENASASKPVAQCRIAAASKDAWEACD